MDPLKITRKKIWQKSRFFHPNGHFFPKDQNWQKLPQYQKNHLSPILKVFLKQSENIEKIDLPKI